MKGPVGPQRLRPKSEITRRPDGRPEAYDIPPGAVMGCIACMATGKMAGYPYQQVFLVNPLDNPLNTGTECHLCREHLLLFLPNVVIVDPSRGWQCRDAKGKTWREDE